MKTNILYRLAVLLCLAIALLVLPAISKAQSAGKSKMWINAYYTTWGACEMPPQDIDYSAVTHIVHQSIDPTANSAYAGRWWRFPNARWADDREYFEQGAGTGCTPFPLQRMLIDSAHAHGVKVLLGLGANEHDYAAIASNPTMLQQYVTSVLDYAKSKGYDGVDVDWEFVRDGYRQGFINMMKLFRQELDKWSPRGLLTIAVPGWYNPNNDIATLNATVDQVNLMTYDMSGYWEPVTGFNAAMKHPGISPYSGANAEMWTNGWLGNGLNPAITGFGVPFYGLVWEGATGPGQPFSREYQVSYNWIMAKYSASTYRWHEQSQVPYLSVANSPDGKQYFISYDDSASLSIKVDYAKSRGLGGIMIFELWRGLLDGKQPLMDAVKRATWGDSSAGRPGIPNLVSPVDTSKSQPQTLIVRWNSVATARMYQLQIAENANFSMVIMNDSTITDSIRNVVGLSANTQYYWRVRAINENGVGDYSTVFTFTTTLGDSLVTGVDTKNPGTPQKFSLDQNYPNPFNPSTRISYTIPEPSIVTVTVYNAIGQKVATLVDGSEQMGSYNTIWDADKSGASQLATGLYFYRVHAVAIKGGKVYTDTKKMMFMK